MPIDWAALGSALDPDLWSEAVRVVSAMQPRSEALASVGRMVAMFPPESRHLGVAVLSRLSDRPSDPLLPQTIAALSSAAWAVRSPTSPAHATPVFVAPPPAIDMTWLERAYAPLSRQEALDTRRRAGPLDAQHRAVELVALAGTRSLADAPERAEMVAEALALWASESAPFDTIEPALVRHLLALAAPGDARWIDCLADALDGHRWDRAMCLYVLGAMAPVLVRLCGGDFVAALVDRLGATPPVPSFARPWLCARLTTSTRDTSPAAPTS